MKKATFEAIYSALTNYGFDNQDIMDELSKEIHKGAEVKAKNAETYAKVYPIVMGALSSTPVTLSELYDEIKSQLPEGFEKGKLQYAVTRLWADLITKTEGKVNTYSLKA